MENNDIDKNDERKMTSTGTTVDRLSFTILDLVLILSLISVVFVALSFHFHAAYAKGKSTSLSFSGYSWEGLQGKLHVVSKEYIGHIESFNVDVWGHSVKGSMSGNVYLYRVRLNNTSGTEEMDEYLRVTTFGQYPDLDKKIKLVKIEDTDVWLTILKSIMASTSSRIASAVILFMAIILTIGFWRWGKRVPIIMQILGRKSGV